MSIYDIDFKKTATELLPPDKRSPILTRLIQAFLSPLQWFQGVWFNAYRTGSTAQPWILGTYKKYDQVIYKQSVYESLKDANTDLPTLQASWFKVQDNFIGVEERALYAGNKLLFEYGINKYFGTVFRQPPNTSDIYLQALPKPKDVFVVGGSEKNSSVVFSGSSSSFVINSYSFGTYHNLNIYVPLVVYNSLDNSALNRERIVRNYADKYIVAGIVFNIVPY